MSQAKYRFILGYIIFPTILTAIIRLCGAPMPFWCIFLPSIVMVGLRVIYLLGLTYMFFMWLGRHPEALSLRHARHSNKEDEISEEVDEPELNKADLNKSP